MNPLIIKNITKTTIFLLPLALSDNITYREFITKDFINAYLGDTDKETSKEALEVYVLRKVNKRGSMNEVERYKKSNDKIVYIYELPAMRESVVRDYLHLLAGEYSKISEKSKQRILNFWNCTKDTDELYLILYKEPEKLKPRSKKGKRAKINAEPTESELYPPFEIMEELIS